jgi:hypothetical protein
MLAKGTETVHRGTAFLAFVKILVGVALLHHQGGVGLLEATCCLIYKLGIIRCG